MPKEKEFNFHDFIKKFMGLDIMYESSQSVTKLFGCEAVTSSIKSAIDGVIDPKSIVQHHKLITGPTGSGKTSVVHNVCKNHASGKLHYIYINTSWTLWKQFGNPEERLVQIIDEAIRKSPSVIFIDELDVIADKKRNQNDVGRIFNVLVERLQCLRRLSARVLVLGATNDPDALHPQLSRYFKSEIRFTLPTLQDRRDFLIYTINCLSPRHQSSIMGEMDKIAEATHYYSYEDLKRLCQDAVLSCGKGDLSYKDFEKALAKFKPQLLKSITSPCTPVEWEDIGGVESIKKELQLSVIWPVKYPQKYQRLGLTPPKGILLYGPPGCSKTMLAQALATESGFNFIYIGGPELNTKYVGETEAAVRRLYRNAREISPCIIFFDEIDGFATERADDSNSPVGDRVTAQLLTELNEVRPLDNVFTIAATNRPDKVDSALLRPERLDPAIYVPLPSEKDRVEIFIVHMRKLRQLNLGKGIETTARDLAHRTDGYSGADIARVCQVAGQTALREDLGREDSQIELRHFEEALEKVKPKTRPSQLKRFAEFQETTMQEEKQKSLAVVKPHLATTFRTKIDKLMKSLSPIRH